jgi:uncharacterized protein (TIGR00290 family)
MGMRTKAVLSWSSGKDSAFALHQVRQAGEYEVIGVLTTVTADYQRVSMHGVREELLDAQVSSLGLPCRKIRIPAPCPNAIYELEMATALAEFRERDVRHVVFGDLFLEDIRAYREARLAEVGMEGVFPLWMRDTTALAREMLEAGVQATLTCVDLKKLDASFAGKSFDASLLAALPTDIDPCGENGEFHTFTSAGPMFKTPIAFRSGDVVIREGFAFADLLPSK